MTFLLKIYDETITYDSCGECHWNKQDDIIDNVSIENIDKSFDEVPKEAYE